MTAKTVLYTERLLLRPFQDDDVEDALAYRDDVEFARFLPHIPQPFTREDAEALVALNMSEPWAQSPTFAVVFAGTLDTRHARSQRVMEKLGMRRETVRLNDRIGRDGAPFDQVVYGLDLA